MRKKIRTDIESDNKEIKTLIFKNNTFYDQKVIQLNSLKERLS